MDTKSFKWLTTRDMQTLKTLYYHRFMSTDQIRRLFYLENKEGEENQYSDIVARRRLKKLREKKLIKSYHRADNKDMVHTLANDGLYIVASIMGTNYNNLYLGDKKDLLAYSAAQHSIMITEIYIKLLEHLKDKEGTIELFQVEKHNEKRFEYEGEQYKFRPDVFMIYRPYEGREGAVLYFLEVDNNTAYPLQFKSKIEPYEAYYKTNLFQEQWGGLFPEIIVVCNHQTRIDRLRGVTDTFLKWRYVLFDKPYEMLYN